MTRHHIDYGIDLGTTNSAIARVDHGKIRLFQHEPFKKSILPSCVSFKRGTVFVGDKAYDRFRSPATAGDTFTGFKRTMGESKTYTFEESKVSMSSEELSAEVLKQLKLAVKDEAFESAVITVPMAFKQVQIEATRRAAKLAGFAYAEFLQEPIAASMAFFEGQGHIEGTWLVFDLGGGTFDAALVRMEDGIMKVLDHEGDAWLGGRDMDELLAEQVLLPRLEEEYGFSSVRDDEPRFAAVMRTLKHEAEGIRITLTDRDKWRWSPDEPLNLGGNVGKLDVDIPVSRSQVEEVVEPLVTRAIKICDALLSRNNMAPESLTTVLMIGGPTYMPIVRARVKSELKANINVTIDPMTAVAMGAALYASTRKNSAARTLSDRSKIQLVLAYPTTTVEEQVLLGIKVDQSQTATVLPEALFVQVSRSDGAWTSGRVVLSSGKGALQVLLTPNATNGFMLELTDDHGNRIECEPNEVTILQGIKLAQPPLPYDICILAVVRGTEESEELVPIIAKGTALPAICKKKFFTPVGLRPGKKEDVLKLMVWEGKGGTRPIRNTFMKQILITGERLPSFLPEDSEMWVTIRLDESRLAKISAYFPYLDETIEEVADPDGTLPPVPLHELHTQASSDAERLEQLEEKASQLPGEVDADFDTLSEELADLTERIESEGAAGDHNQQLKNRLNELSMKIDEIEAAIRWPLSRSALEEQLERTKYYVEKFGDAKATAALKQFADLSGKVVTSANVQRAKELTDRLRALEFQVLREQQGFWISVLKSIADDFNEIQWNDRRQARELVDRGVEILNSKGWSDDIKQVVGELWSLMPDVEREKRQTPRTDIPHYR